MAYRTPFLEAIKVRRSVLSLAKESPISDDRIVMCVNHAIKHAPSPFNVQSCRAIVLFGAEHEKLWDIGMEESRKTLPPPAFAQYEPKIQGFRDAYGTVSQSLLLTAQTIDCRTDYLSHRFSSSRIQGRSRLSHLHFKTSWQSTRIGTSIPTA